VTLAIRGCYNRPLADDHGTTTVDIWTDNTKATHVATGITGVSNVLEFADLAPAVAPPAAYYFEAVHSSGRFKTYSGTVVCGASINVDFGPIPATGYRCFSADCALPISTTLYYTDDEVGTVALAYDPLVGYIGGPVTFDYAGCTFPVFPFSCPAGPVSAMVVYNGDALGGYRVRHRLATAPPVDPYYCPATAPAGTLANGTIHSHTVVCPPALLITITHTPVLCNAGTYTGIITE
jgi:hypothetical protein